MDQTCEVTGLAISSAERVQKTGHSGGMQVKSSVMTEIMSNKNNNLVLEKPLK